MSTETNNTQTPAFKSMDPVVRHNAITHFMDRSFGGGDRVIYKGKQYPIISVDFEEQLVGIPSPYEGCDENEIQWVRCENVEIIPFGVEVA